MFAFTFGIARPAGSRRPGVGASLNFGSVRRGGGPFTTSRLLGDYLSKPVLKRRPLAVEAALQRRHGLGNCPFASFTVKSAERSSLGRRCVSRGGAAAEGAGHIRFSTSDRWDYPLNLSISLSGGKETNRDSLSSCERTGNSPAPNPAGPVRREMWR